METSTKLRAESAQNQYLGARIIVHCEDFTVAEIRILKKALFQLRRKSIQLKLNRQEFDTVEDILNRLPCMEKLADEIARTAPINPVHPVNPVKKLK